MLARTRTLTANCYLLIANLRSIALAVGVLLGRSPSRRPRRTKNNAKHFVFLLKIFRVAEIFKP